MTSSIDTSPDRETRPSFMETLAASHVSAITELIEKMLEDKIEVALYDVASDAWSSDETLRELYSFLAEHVKSLGFECYLADGKNRVELLRKMDMAWCYAKRCASVFAFPACV